MGFLGLFQSPSLFKLMIKFSAKYIPKRDGLYVWTTVKIPQQQRNKIIYCIWTVQWKSTKCVTYDHLQCSVVRSYGAGINSCHGHHLFFSKTEQQQFHFIHKIKQTNLYFPVLITLYTHCRDNKNTFLHSIISV